jgi:hypothetical protein
MSYRASRAGETSATRAIVSDTFGVVVKTEVANTQST